MKIIRFIALFIIGIVGLTILAQYIGIYVAFIVGLGIVILVIRQDLKDKNILLVWGGWDGHNPELFVNHIEKWLISENANYTIHNGVSAYDNYEELIKYDLIIQSITMGQIGEEELNNLLKAVANGVGFSGAHGGIADSFRNNPSYQFMVGGQWVSHPGGKVKFKVNILEDELTDGIQDFELFSEQWYVHYDPNVDIIATTI